MRARRDQSEIQFEDELGPRGGHAVDRADDGNGRVRTRRHGWMSATNEEGHRIGGVGGPS